MALVLPDEYNIILVNEEKEKVDASKIKLKKNVLIIIIIINIDTKCEQSLSGNASDAGS